ncbi:MAG: helix-turn-helix transcriptional regulator [Alistipes sp.]|nr:helix-turn-helix transcriptional regulator [Alistipes sp.]
MNNCLHAENRRNCGYYPDCAGGYLGRSELQPGESRGYGLHGPCVLYLHSGELSVACNENSCDITAPAYILIPHAPFILTAKNAVISYIFGPDIVSRLARKLRIDLTVRHPGRHKTLSPTLLLDANTAMTLSRGTVTDLCGCRRYVEYKFQEIIHNISPERYAEIESVLASRDWFFRMKTEDLTESCRSLAEFAAGTGLSRSGFSKAFRKVYGRSFYNWYQDRKYSSVVKELTRTNLSLSRLAEKYGFFSVQHFGNFIKKRSGLPPGRLRLKLWAKAEHPG